MDSIRTALDTIFGVNGRAKDTERGMRLLTVENQLPTAQFLIANIDIAFDKLKHMADDEGNLYAQFYLGYLHENGISTMINKLEAFRYYHKSATAVHVYPIAGWWRNNHQRIMMNVLIEQNAKLIAQDAKIDRLEKQFVHLQASPNTDYKAAMEEFELAQKNGVL